MTTWKLKLTAAVAAGFLGLAGTGTYLAMGQTNGPKSLDSNTNPSVEPADPAVRKVLKSTEGRMTAYPELHPINKSFAIPRQAERPQLPTNILPTDIRQLYFDRIRQLCRAIDLDIEVVKVGSWDTTFLNQFIGNLEELSDAAKKAFPNPADHIPYLRYCVAVSGGIENVVHERVYTAQNLREQSFRLITAARLRCETNLYEAEQAAKKAAPAAGGR
jgi:hypothetical protein